MDIDKMLYMLDVSRESLLKAAQYLSILLAWFQERNNDK